jgi:hypothetical protein
MRGATQLRETSRSRAGTPGLPTSVTSTLSPLAASPSRVARHQSPGAFSGMRTESPRGTKKPFWHGGSLHIARERSR